MKYRFLSPASVELAKAVDYYEDARPGLGMELLDEIEQTISKIVLYPNAWLSVSENHRRCRTRRFPYGLFYTLEEGVVVITAVMNLRQEPDSWIDR